MRYLNSLPAPPLNPKFLQYNTSEQTSTHQENIHLLSSLFRKENFSSFLEAIDEDHGMPLNLINNPGFLDDGKEDVIYGIKTAELHPHDRMLLRDAGIGKISKSEPGVSFLRRTEYIAEKQIKATEEKAPAKPKKNDDKLDPESQLLAVENTFDEAQNSLNDLSKLHHPRKKNLKAVATFPLLPDTASMDLKFLSVKFTGSASLNRELQELKRQEKDRYDEEFQRNVLLSTIYKPITSEDGEWISLYQLNDSAKAASLTEKLNSTEKERPVNLLDEQEDLEEFRFKHTKNYDMKYQRFTKPYEELAIKFVPGELASKKRVAHYYPISGKIDLKKHRASTNAEINKFLKDSTVDVVNFKLREPNTNELKRMDAVRSEFDPMEYEGEEEEEEEEEEGFADDFDKDDTTGAPEANGDESGQNDHAEPDEDNEE